MKVTLQNIVPNPMKDEAFSAESIWGKVCVLDSNHSYLISSNSGKGKSTLLSYIYGLRADYSGSISIDLENQQNISIDSWSKLRTNKLSYLLQDLRLFNHLSVWDNLILKNNLTKHKTAAQIEEMLDEFGLLPKKNQLAGRLSLGQQQRVALIRCLLQPFEFLLLDEPFSNIDETNIQIAKRLIEQECKANNAGFILATLGHDYQFENVTTIYL
ncbi:ATP-binding cassette domain-containing protein [bacterium]|nr:ATP-binding cassette domain-containing protein [bacterium]